jgi:hypothetical protein
MTDLLLQPMVIVDGQIVGGIAVFCALQNVKSFPTSPRLACS